MMSLKRTLVYLLCLPALVTACSEDDYVYPDLVTEIVCLKTDAKGKGNLLVTDQGKEWSIQPVTGLDDLSVDSTYRVISKYVPLSNAGGTKQEAKVYAVQGVTAPIPLPEAKFKNIKTDPVEIQSIWRSGDYLNLILQVMVKEELHGFHFIENKIETGEGGIKTLHLTLYHDKKGDAEAFYRKTYLSVPLWAYKGRLNKGDRIIFRLNTYKEGMTSRTFTY